MCYISGMLNVFEQTIDMPGLVQQQARTIETLEAQVALLKEQLAWLQKQVFGAKSERIVADLGQQDLTGSDRGSDQAKHPKS